MQRLGFPFQDLLYTYDPAAIQNLDEAFKSEGYQCENAKQAMEAYVKNYLNVFLSADNKPSKLLENIAQFYLLMFLRKLEIKATPKHYDAFCQHPEVLQAVETSLGYIVDVMGLPAISAKFLENQFYIENNILLLIQGENGLLAKDGYESRDQVEQDYEHAAQVITDAMRELVCGFVEFEYAESVFNDLTQSLGIGDTQFWPNKQISDKHFAFSQNKQRLADYDHGLKLPNLKISKGLLRQAIELHSKAERKDKFPLTALSMSDAMACADILHKVDFHDLEGWFLVERFRRDKEFRLWGSSLRAYKRVCSVKDMRILEEYLSGLADGNLSHSKRSNAQVSDLNRPTPAAYGGQLNIRFDTIPPTILALPGMSYDEFEASAAEIGSDGKVEVNSVMSHCYIEEYLRIQRGLSTDPGVDVPEGIEAIRRSYMEVLYYMNSYSKNISGDDVRRSAAKLKCHFHAAYLYRYLPEELRKNEDINTLAVPGHPKNLSYLPVDAPNYEAVIQSFYDSLGDRPGYVRGWIDNIDFTKITSIELIEGYCRLLTLRNLLDFLQVLPKEIVCDRGLAERLYDIDFNITLFLEPSVLIKKYQHDKNAFIRRVLTEPPVRTQIFSGMPLYSESARFLPLEILKDKVYKDSLLSHSMFYIASFPDLLAAQIMLSTSQQYHRHAPQGERLVDTSKECSREESFLLNAIPCASKGALKYLVMMYTTYPNKQDVYIRSIKAPCTTIPFEVADAILGQCDPDCSEDQQLILDTLARTYLDDENRARVLFKFRQRVSDLAFAKKLVKFNMLNVDNLSPDLAMDIPVLIPDSPIYKKILFDSSRLNYFMAFGPFLVNPDQAIDFLQKGGPIEALPEKVCESHMGEILKISSPMSVYNTVQQQSGDFYKVISSSHAQLWKHHPLAAAHVLIEKKIGFVASMLFASTLGWPLVFVSSIICIFKTYMLKFVNLFMHTCQKSIVALGRSTINIMIAPIKAVDLLTTYTADMVMPSCTTKERGVQHAPKLIS